MPDMNNFTLDDIVSDTPVNEFDGDQGDKSSTKVEDPVLADIDNMFGGPGDDSSSGRHDKSDDSSSYKKDDVFDMGPKNPQAVIAKLQSERDKIKADNERMQKDLQQFKSVAEFTSSLWDDKEARHAFIATLEPDLVKPKDPLTFVKEGLKKEFGEEFSPTAEGADPLQVQLYHERSRELYTEWRTKQTGLPKDLNELKTRRAKLQKEAQDAAKAEKDKIVQDFKWDDSAWEDFTKWGQGFKLYHLAKLYSKAKDGSRGSAPQLGLQIGGRPLTPAKYKQHLDAMFGSN